MRALLVIDIHTSWGWGSAAPYPPDRQPVVDALAGVLRSIRIASQTPIVFIMLKPHFGNVLAQTDQNFCIGCADENDRLPDFLGHRHSGLFEPIFTKNTNDAFANSQLAEYLRKKGVVEVMLAGCNTNGCVAETAKGALRNGFHVTLLYDCTYPPFTSEIEKARWIQDVQLSVGLQDISASLSVRIE